MDLDAQILALLSEAPGGLLTQEIATKLSLPRMDISEALRPLEDAGKVVSREDRGAMRWELAS